MRTHALGYLRFLVIPVNGSVAEWTGRRSHYPEYATEFLRMDEELDYALATGVASILSGKEHSNRERL